MLDIRAGLMTDFVRKVRKALNQIGQQKGMHMSCLCGYGRTSKMSGLVKQEEGLDVKLWIKEGLLYSVIC